MLQVQPICYVRCVKSYWRQIRERGNRLVSPYLTAMLPSFIHSSLSIKFSTVTPRLLIYLSSPGSTPCVATILIRLWAQREPWTRKPQFQSLKNPYTKCIEYGLGTDLCTEHEDCERSFGLFERLFWGKDSFKEYTVVQKANERKAEFEYSISRPYEQFEDSVKTPKGVEWSSEGLSYNHMEQHT